MDTAETPPTLLVVEDNEDIRTPLARLLERGGYRVLTAADGAEGVRMAQLHVPRLILLDLAMPVLDGWEALRRLRENAWTSWIPVVVMTAFDLSVRELRSAGAQGYLRKPFGVAAVEELVRRTVGQRETLALPGGRG